MYEGKGLVDKDILIKGVKNVIVLISLLFINVDKDVIDVGKDLKIIVNYGVGFNNIDIEYVWEKSIDVINIFKVLINVIVDLIIGLVFVVVCCIVEGD